MRLHLLIPVTVFTHWLTFWGILDVLKHLKNPTLYSITRVTVLKATVFRKKTTPWYVGIGIPHVLWIYSF